MMYATWGAASDSVTGELVVEVSAVAGCVFIMSPRKSSFGENLESRK